jgi:hypothetical protein
MSSDSDSRRSTLAAVRRRPSKGYQDSVQIKKEERANAEREETDPRDARGRSQQNIKTLCVYR